MPTELDRLGARWQKELRVRFRGDPSLLAPLTERARRQVGGMERTRALAGTNFAHLNQQYPDGTRIRTIFDGLNVIAEIDAPEPSEASTPSPITPWIPQGFVVVPASAAALDGWGLPVLATDTPLDPGPLTAAWSENGALPQVLLTDVSNAGYPDDENQSLVLYFDDFEDPILDIELPAEDAAWTAYRPKFRDLGEAFTALLGIINSRRDPAEPLCGPFAGYADMAAEYSKLTTQFGFDESGYPIGSATVFRRVEKEGTVATVGTDSARGSLGSGTISPDATLSQIADALEAAEPALTDATLKCGSSFSLVGATSITSALLDHNPQWVHCGNIDWVSTEPEIPRLSWFGPRGRGVPAYEMASGLFPIGLSGSEYVWKSYQIDEAVRKIGKREEREFDRYIYARGRMLAQLPNDGYVLGAAVQKISQQQDGETIYRLVAIAWHRADQKQKELQDGALLPITPGPGWYDTTSDIRLWWVDLPTRDGLTCMPPYVVDGAFDEVLNPYGWQGGSRHRLSDFAGKMHAPGNFLNADGLHSASSQGYDQNSLAAPKVYWHPWFFDGSGEHAVCMRADAFGGRGVAGVFYATMLWPSQLLQLTAQGGAFPDVTLTSLWEVGGDQGTDVPNPAVFAPPTAAAAERYVAADYVAGGLRIVQLTGGAHPDYRLSSPRGTLEDYSNFIATSHRFGIGYLDARNDNRIVIEYLGDFGATPPGGEPPQTAVVSVKANGSIVSRSFTDSTFRPAWFDNNAFNLTLPDSPSMTQEPFGIHTSPGAGSAFTSGNFRFFGAHMAARDDAFVGGWRYGTIDLASPFTIATFAGDIASSIDEIDTLLDVTNGWLNFAGVVG